MKVYITTQQAINILTDRQLVHTLCNLGILVGANWERTEIVKKIKHSDVLELAGPTARGMGHGLCIYNNNAIDTFDILFIETDEEKLKELEKSIKRE